MKNALLVAVVLLASGCAIETDFHAKASLFRHDERTEADMFAQAVRMLREPNGMKDADIVAVLIERGASKDEAKRLVALAKADLACCLASPSPTNSN